MRAEEMRVDNCYTFVVHYHTAGGTGRNNPKQLRVLTFTEEMARKYCKRKHSSARIDRITIEK